MMNNDAYFEAYLQAFNEAPTPYDLWREEVRLSTLQALDDGALSPDMGDTSIQDWASSEAACYHNQGLLTDWATYPEAQIYIDGEGEDALYCAATAAIYHIATEMMN